MMMRMIMSSSLRLVVTLLALVVSTAVHGSAAETLSCPIPVGDADPCVTAETQRQCERLIHEQGCTNLIWMVDSCPLLLSCGGYAPAAPPGNLRTPSSSDADVDSEREDESPSTSPKLLLSMGTGAGFLAVLLALVLRRAAKRAAAEMHKNDDDDDDAATVDEEDTASLP